MNMAMTKLVMFPAVAADASTAAAARRVTASFRPRQVVVPLPSRGITDEMSHLAKMLVPKAGQR